MQIYRLQCIFMQPTDSSLVTKNNHTWRTQSYYYMRFQYKQQSPAAALSCHYFSAIQQQQSLESCNFQGFFPLSQNTKVIYSQQLSADHNLTRTYKNITTYYCNVCNFQSSFELCWYLSVRTITDCVNSQHSTFSQVQYNFQRMHVTASFGVTSNARMSSRASVQLPMHAYHSKLLFQSSPQKIIFFTHGIITRLQKNRYRYIYIYSDNTQQYIYTQQFSISYKVFFYCHIFFLNKVALFLLQQITFQNKYVAEQIQLCIHHKNKYQKHIYTDAGIPTHKKITSFKKINQETAVSTIIL
eukprot:TRINITY_DN2652_c0_g1_i6.p2 TRINITY_DN2652_c0_g1~~TRINITY_DN2652_c0_g1_i6.p2  ORF type:complete len:299 (+),score=-23.64 TRINITY_DN2652_c0_g1_i6:437-1333(+)